MFGIDYPVLEHSVNTYIKLRFWGDSGHILTDWLLNPSLDFPVLRYLVQPWTWFILTNYFVENEAESTLNSPLTLGKSNLNPFIKMNPNLHHFNNLYQMICYRTFEGITKEKIIPENLLDWQVRTPLEPS